MARLVAAARRRPLGVAAAAVVALDVLLRLVLGAPYPGATALLLLACGISAVPFLPSEVARVSLRVAVVPALGVVSFSVLLTTLSVLGVELTEVSIRLAVLVLVVVLAAFHPAGTRAPPAGRGDAIALAGLACIVVFALAAAWDLVGPFPPPGVDWGHYLLYAEEVAAERELLVENRFAGEDGRLFATPPGVGALYGGMLMLDGVDPTRLALGVIVISALSPLAVFVAGGSLWGLSAGLVAASAYAVSPIHMDPIRWHGVGTTLALAFVPLVVLALGLMFRGARSWQVSALLAMSTLGIAVTHSTSAFVAAFFLGVAVAVDAVRHVAVRRDLSLRTWWERGIARPLLAGLAGAAVIGAAVLVHLREQAADLGSPVSYRLLELDWLSWSVIEHHYSLVFLALAAISLVLVLASRSLRRDAALLALVSLAVACVVVGELWRLEIPFEYRRVLHYFGIALALLVGAASIRIRAGPWTAVAYLAVLALVAHESVGLRLPQRVLAEREAMGTSTKQLIGFGGRVDRRELPDASLVVADECMSFVVPYVLRRPTIIAFEPWQVGFESRVPLAERAQAVLEGGERGRRLAAELGVDYVVANPSCRPELEDRLAGTAVVQTDELVVLDLRGRGESS